MNRNKFYSVLQRDTQIFVFLWDPISRSHFLWTLTYFKGQVPLTPKNLQEMACFVIIISNNATVFCKGILVFWVLWAPLFRRHQKNLHPFTLGYMDFLLFEAVLLSLKFLVFKCPVFHFLCAFTYGLWKFCFGYFVIFW